MSSPLLLSVCGDNGSTLTTSFQFVDGRFRHSITLRDSDGKTIDHWDDEAQSDNDDWPASPPIQQLSLESIHGSSALLGVGQAGKSHWSISVEATLLDSKPVLKFDLACRCRAQPSWLGSTYQRLVSIADQVPMLRVIDVEPIKPSADGTLILSCEVAPSPSPKYPTTFRWSYLVTVAN